MLHTLRRQRRPGGVMGRTCRERDSEAGRGAMRKTGLLPVETATLGETHGATDREGDEMQSGNLR